ncbi:MAG: nucleolar RNA-binding Nop10p family protein [Candidatus Micrarchaeia archaeon]|jgi:H/ACA ribonucleoprotein complex subunit 3
MKKLKRCASCGSYTMLAEHCGKAANTAHPPKYSPEDKYGKYRRMEKFGKESGA